MPERDADELLERLRDTGEQFPQDLREAILEAESEGVDREALVDGLIDVMQDRSLQPMDNAEARSPCSHAAMLLGLLGAEEAVEPLLNEVVRHSPAASMATAAAQALSGMADVAQDRLVERYEAAEWETTRRRLARAVTGLAPEGDERGLELLVRELMSESEPMEGHGLLTDIAQYATVLDVAPKDYAPRLQKWFKLNGPDREAPTRSAVEEGVEQAIEALEK